MMVAMPNRDEASVDSPPETVEESTNEATTVSATVEPKNDPPAESVAVYMPPHMLAHMYCDDEGVRYALNGIQVDPTRGRIAVTDGKVLAIISAKQLFDIPVFQPVILSSESVRAALKMAKIDGRYVFLRFDPSKPANKAWSFEGRRDRTKDAVVWSLGADVCDGRFPQVDNVMPPIGDTDKSMVLNPWLLGQIIDHWRMSRFDMCSFDSDVRLQVFIDPARPIARSPLRMRGTGMDKDGNYAEIDLVLMPMADDSATGKSESAKPRPPAVHVCLVEFSGCSAQPQFANRLDAIKWGLDQAKRYRPDQYFMTLGRLSADHPGFTSEDHLLAISELLTGFDRLAVCELQSAESAASLLRDALAGDRVGSEEN